MPDSDPKSNDPKKTEQGADPAAGGKPAEPKVPEKITIRRHGRDVELPYAKVLELANAGLDIGERGSALDARERALRANETGFQEYQRLRAALDANPTMARALEIATRDPDRVLHPRSPASTSEDPFGDPEEREERAANGSVPAGVAQELANLRAEINDLRGRDRQRSVESARERVERLVRTSLGDHPWLQGKMKQTAEKLVLAELSSGSGNRSVDDVVATVAADMRSGLDEDAQRRLDQQAERAALRTSRPFEGIPGLEPGTKFGKKELEDGTLATRAAEALRGLLGRKG